MNIPSDIIDRLIELPIEDVARRLGIEVEGHKAKCFMHNDHSPSLSFSVAKNIYRCWVCNKGGNTIQLVRDKEGLDFKEACLWLAKGFNIYLPDNERYIWTRKKIVRNTPLSTTRKTPPTPIDAEMMNWLIETARLSEAARKFLFEERLYDEDVIQSLNIKSITYPEKVVEALLSRYGKERSLSSGLVTQGRCGLYFHFYTPCLLYPYYDKNGHIIGVQSRYLGNNPKAARFQFLSSQKTRLFNLPILNHMREGDPLFISEGITDCFALLSTGKKAVAIPSATSLPYEDLFLLRNYKLHMYPDKDESGQRAFIELRHFFINNYATLIREQLPQGIKDYSEYYITKLKHNG